MSLPVLASAAETPSQSAHPMDHAAYMDRRYMPELDGLRALAVCLVITCHLHTAMWTPLSGHLGVTIFFVLSGYLITRLALGEQSATGMLNLKAFFVRRSFRIFPLYYLFVALYCLLILKARLWPDKIEPFRQSLPYYLAYFQELPFWTHSHGPNPPPFYHTWSLGIEEKFYLLWPFALVAMKRLSTLVRASLTAALVVVCVTQGFISERWPTYHLESYGFILMGACLAILLTRPSFYKTFKSLQTSVVWCSAAVASATQFYLIPHTHLRGLSTLYAVAITLLIGALVSTPGIVSRYCSSPALVLTGRLSYGIYLSHILCLGIVEKFAKPEHGKIVGILAYLGTLGLSFLVAYGSNRAVEQPMINLGRRISKRLIVLDTPRPALHAEESAVLAQ